jgi:hypothetical protein
MARKCSTCQHIKREEIDRRLAAGEPASQIARDYDLNPSSLHRHRTNCLGLASSNQIMKQVSRGTAAITCLPSREDLNAAYFDLQARIDQIVSQAQQQGSLAIAISGLNSIRHTLDSLSRLAGYDRPAGTQVNVALQTNVQLNVTQIAERVIKHFDHEPELKARIAQALLGVADEQSAAVTHEQSVGVADEQSAAVVYEQSAAVVYEQSAAVTHEQSASVIHEQSAAVADEKSVGVANEQSA